MDIIGAIIKHKVYVPSAKENREQQALLDSNKPDEYTAGLQYYNNVALGTADKLYEADKGAFVCDKLTVTTNSVYAEGLRLETDENTAYQVGGVAELRDMVKLRREMERLGKHARTKKVRKNKYGQLSKADCVGSGRGGYFDFEVSGWRFETRRHVAGDHKSKGWYYTSTGGCYYRLLNPDGVSVGGIGGGKRAELVRWAYGIILISR